MNHLLEQLTGQVRRALEQELAPLGVEVTGQFPGRPRPLPLRRTVVAAGLQDAELQPRALGDYLGPGPDGGAAYGRTLEVTVSLRVYAPPGGDPGCPAAFELLCGALLFGRLDFEVRRVWCGELAFDKDQNAFLLPCFARLRLALCRVERPEGGVDFEIRRVTQ